MTVNSKIVNNERRLFLTAILSSPLVAVFSGCGGIVASGEKCNTCNGSGKKFGVRFVKAKDGSLLTNLVGCAMAEPSGKSTGLVGGLILVIRVAKLEKEIHQQIRLVHGVMGKERQTGGELVKSVVEQENLDTNNDVFIHWKKRKSGGRKSAGGSDRNTSQNRQTYTVPLLTPFRLSFLSAQFSPRAGTEPSLW